MDHKQTRGEQARGAVGRRHRPQIFSIVPQVCRDTRRSAPRASAELDLSAELAQKTDEAEQNWRALNDVRKQKAVLDAQNEELRQALGELQQERDDERAVSESLRQEVKSLRQEIGRLGRKIGDLKRDNTHPEGAAERIAAAERRAVEAERKTVEALLYAEERARAGAADPTARDVRSLKAVLRWAATNCPTVSIPPEVAKRAAVLDESGSRKSRGAKVAKVLAAMHAYVLDQSFKGDFRQWCANGGRHGAAISANQIAMSESANVQRRERMAAQRSFPVDVTLDRSGRHDMLAHVKLDRGPSAPRLYFLDDKTGQTGKIHIGYIGPHLSTNTDPT